MASVRSALLTAISAPAIWGGVGVAVVAVGERVLVTVPHAAARAALLSASAHEPRLVSELRHRIRATVDPSDSVHETSESDNSLAGGCPPQG